MSPINAARASKPKTTPRAIAVVRFLLFLAFAAAIAAAAEDEAAAASAVLDADWEVRVVARVVVGVVVGVRVEVGVGVEKDVVEGVSDLDDLVTLGVADELVAVAVSIDLKSV